MYAIETYVCILYKLNHGNCTESQQFLHRQWMEILGQVIAKVRICKEYVTQDVAL